MTIENMTPEQAATQAKYPHFKPDMPPKPRQAAKKKKISSNPRGDDIERQLLSKGLNPHVHGDPGQKAWIDCNRMLQFFEDLAAKIRGRRTDPNLSPAGRHDLMLKYRKEGTEKIQKVFDDRDWGTLINIENSTLLGRKDKRQAKHFEDKVATLISEREFRDEYVKHLPKPHERDQDFLDRCTTGRGGDFQIYAILNAFFPLISDQAREQGIQRWDKRCYPKIVQKIKDLKAAAGVCEMLKDGLIRDLEATGK